MEKNPCVYMLASGRNGDIYIGVTSDLHKRVWQHKEKTYPGWSAEKGADKLVWFETHGSMESAIAREKQMKQWPRLVKKKTIERFNPEWDDLFDSLG